MSPVSVTASVHYIKEMAEGVRDAKMKIKLLSPQKGGERTLFGHQQFITQRVG